MLVGSVVELQRLVRELNDDISESTAERLLAEVWREPASGFSYAALGAALLQHGLVTSAQQALDRAHYLQPDNPQILYHYGLTLELAGRPADARLRYEAALRIYPAYADARRRLTEMGTANGERPSPAIAPTASPQPPFRPTPPPTPGVSFPSASTPPFAGQPTGGIPAPLFPPPDRPRRPTQPLPEVEWEPEPAPGFSELASTAIQLWGQQPLLWLLILGIPNAMAAITLSVTPLQAWAVPLAWLLALVVGAAPAILAMAGQEIHDRPFAPPWILTPGRWLRGSALLFVLLLLTVAPIAVGLVLRSPLTGETSLLAGLLLASPFHALLAPAVVLSTTTGPGGWRGLWTALRLAERRTWLHLLVILVVGTLLGAGLLVVGSALDFLLQGVGEVGTARWVFRVAGIALGQSIWAAFITVCGLDALEAISNPDSGEWELERLDEPTE